MALMPASLRELTAFGLRPTAFEVSKGLRKFHMLLVQALGLMSKHFVQMEPIPSENFLV